MKIINIDGENNKNKVNNKKKRIEKNHRKIALKIFVIVSLVFLVICEISISAAPWNTVEQLSVFMLHNNQFFNDRHG